MLNQIGVVFSGEVFPLWTSKTASLSLRVSTYLPELCNMDSDSFLFQRRWSLPVFHVCVSLALRKSLLRLGPDSAFLLQVCPRILSIVRKCA
jgi:hypothetical protein